MNATRRKFTALAAASSMVSISGCSVLDRSPPTEYSITSTDLGFVNDYLVCVLECDRTDRTNDTVDIEFEATVDGFPKVARERVTVDEEVVDPRFSIALPFESTDELSAVESASVRVVTSEGSLDEADPIETDRSD